MGSAYYQQSFNANQLSGKKYEFPYCLSIVLLKIQDVIFKNDLKKENKMDVDTVRILMIMWTFSS
jgi:hypothetical protein